MSLTSSRKRGLGFRAADTNLLANRGLGHGHEQLPTSLSDVLLDHASCDVADLDVGVRGDAQQERESTLVVEAVLRHDESESLSDRLARSEPLLQTIDLMDL